MALIGYGIDINEHDTDNFPGIIKFVKKYTPDVYNDMLEDTCIEDDGSEDSLEAALDWLECYENDGEEGLHAYLAFVMSKEENIAFESYDDKYRGRYIFICAEMSWDYGEKLRAVTKDEVNEMFRKYISQISEKEYTPDNIYSYENKIFVRE